MADSSNYDEICKQEMRIILLGKTGQGKSALGNSIYGSVEKNFPFKTGASSSSITKSSSCKYRHYHGRKICIIDTPGLFDTRQSNDETMKELTRAFEFASPGPHAFLIVLCGRCTREEETALDLLQKQFGTSVIDYCIVVVTREDELRDKNKEASDTEILDKYFHKAPKTLLDLREKCNNRCILINNRAPLDEREQKIASLVQLITQIERNNNGRWYDHELFQQAEEELLQFEREEKERQRQEFEQKKQQIREEVRKENLPREEALKLENNKIELLREEYQNLQNEIRDLRRRKIQNKTVCNRLFTMIGTVSSLLPKPTFHISYR